MNDAVNESDDEPRTSERGPAADERIVDDRPTVANESGDPDAPGNFVNDNEAGDVPEPNEPG